MATTNETDLNKPMKRESKFAKLVHRFKNEPPMSREERDRLTNPSSSQLFASSSSFLHTYSPSPPHNSSPTKITSNNKQSKLNLYISDDTYSVDYDEEIYQLNMMADVALEKLKTDLELERSLQSIKERLQFSNEMDPFTQQRKEIDITNRYIEKSKHISKSEPQQSFQFSTNHLEEFSKYQESSPSLSKEIPKQNIALEDKLFPKQVESIPISLPTTHHLPTLTENTSPTIVNTNNSIIEIAEKTIIPPPIANNQKEHFVEEERILPPKIPKREIIDMSILIAEVAEENLERIMSSRRITFPFKFEAHKAPIL